MVIISLKVLSWSCAWCLTLSYACFILILSVLWNRDVYIVLIFCCKRCLWLAHGAIVSVPHYSPSAFYGMLSVPVSECNIVASWGRPSLHLFQRISSSYFCQSMHVFELQVNKEVVTYVRLVRGTPCITSVSLFESLIFLFFYFYSHSLLGTSNAQVGECDRRVIL